MCGGCDCGLHDCPGHPKPEPEICKDPANGGPDGGDCGWTNRCRGSIEGCKKGCVWGREVDDAGTAGLLFSVCVLLAAAAYTGGGIAIGIRSGRPRRGLRSHPHYSQFMQLRGLVVDGARFSQRRLRGGEVKEGSVNSHRQQSLLDDEREHSGSSSSSRSKSKKGKKLKRDKASSSSSSTKDQATTECGQTAAAAAAPPSSPAASRAPGTAAGGGGRCEFSVPRTYHCFFLSFFL